MACRSATREPIASSSARIASSSGPPLDIDRLRLGIVVSAVPDAASRRMGVGVVEDVHRLGRSDLELEVVAAARVMDANAESVGIGVPEQHHFKRAGQPLGQLSCGRTHGFASRHPRTAALGDGPWAWVPLDLASLETARAGIGDSSSATALDLLARG